MKKPKSPVDIEFFWYHSFKRKEDSPEHFKKNYDIYLKTLKTPGLESISIFKEQISKNLTKPENNWDITIITRGNLATADAVTLFTLLEKLEEEGKNAIVIAPELEKINTRLRFMYRNTLFITKKEMYDLIKTDCEDRTISTHIMFGLICYLKTNNLCNHFVQWGFHAGVFYLAKLLHSEFGERVLSWHTCKYNYMPNQSYLKAISTGVKEPGYVYYPILFPKLDKSHNDRSLDFKEREKSIEATKLSETSKALLRAKKKGLILASSVARPEKLIEKEFIKTIKSIINKNKSLVYVIFGSKEDKIRLRDYYNDTDRIIVIPSFAPYELDIIYNIIDIYLDPFPFSGGHSLYRALQVGVPTISMGNQKMVTYNSLCKKLAILLKKDLENMKPYNPISAKYGSKSYIQKANNMISLLERKDQELTSIIKKIKNAITKLESDQCGDAVIEWIKMV